MNYEPSALGDDSSFIAQTEVFTGLVHDSCLYVCTAISINTVRCLYYVYRVQK